MTYLLNIFCFHFQVRIVWQIYKRSDMFSTWDMIDLLFQKEFAILSFKKGVFYFGHKKCILVEKGVFWSSQIVNYQTVI